MERRAGLDNKCFTGPVSGQMMARYWAQNWLSLGLLIVYVFFFLSLANLNVCTSVMY